MPITATFTIFPSLLTRLEWFQYSRPDISYEIALLGQVNEKTFQQNFIRNVKIAFKILIYLTKTEESVLLFSKLDKSILTVRVYCDASFTIHNDLAEQLGCIIYIVDKKNNFRIVHWSSHGARRVKR